MKITSVQNKTIQFKGNEHVIMWFDECTKNYIKGLCNG